MNGNENAIEIDLGSLTDVGGSVAVNGNANATEIDLSSLSGVGGSVAVNGNENATEIDLSSLSDVGGSVAVNGNENATEIDLSSLSETGDSVTINDNQSATTIDLGNLDSAGGTVSINDNQSATTIDLGSLSKTGDSVTINDNQSATTIDLGSLSDLDGDLQVTGNLSLSDLRLDALEAVTGNITLHTHGQTALDLSAAMVGGDTRIRGAEMEFLSAQTAAGDTALNLTRSTASMDVTLRSGTFTEPTAFTVQQWSEDQLQPREATDSAGDTFTVDPVAGYQFEFAVPTLGEHAELAFELALLEMSVEDADAMRQFLAAELITLAVLSDEPDATMRLFDVVGPDEEPVPDLSVQMLWLDAERMLVDEIDLAAYARFEGLVGEFSSYALVVIPEPAGLTLLAMGATVLLRRPRAVRGGLAMSSV